MKRILLAMTLFALLLGTLLVLVACSDTCDTCSFGDWVTTAAPDCVTEGEHQRVCTVCGNLEAEKIEALGHEFGEWLVATPATCEVVGESKRVCARCDAFEVEPIPKLVQVYTITMNVNGRTDTVGAPASGAYTLTPPRRSGYIFTGWVDANDQPFPASGTVTADVTVTATWETSDTATFAELKERIEAGAEEIRITADILLTDTIYVVSDTVIYVEQSHTLRRAPSFLGDLFVLGCDPAGKNVLLTGDKAVLTLRTEEGAQLVIDGNKESVEGSVHGTAFFLLNSSELNMYDGVVISNHKKTVNSAEFLNAGHQISETTLPRVGGAAIIVMNGVFTMHGGEICANEVNLRDSKNTSEAEQTEGYDACALGGAIFNNSNVNIYGGVLRDNTAARGGAIYNYRVCNIYGGTLEGNHAAVYGGAIYQADSQYAYSNYGVEGTEIRLLFAQNTSVLSGGAIFAQHQSAITIHGGTAFCGNESQESNGGAINASGELVIYYAEFEENRAASKGGAIYAYYSALEYSTRVVRIHAGLFEANEASRGGAIGLGGETEDSVAKGAILYLGAVTFQNNRAFIVGSSHGNGGALYASQGASITVEGAALFTGNAAEVKGGAAYLTSSATLTVTGSEAARVSFTSNTSGEGGGAVYMYTDTTLSIRYAVFAENEARTTAYGGGALYLSSNAQGTLEHVTFTQNNAIYRGGAIAVYSGATLTGAELTFTKNTAGDCGGAIYTNGATLTLTNITASENSSVTNGGALYSTGSTVTVQGTGSTVSSFTKNTSSEGCGGAIAVHTNTVLNLFGVTFSQNKAEAGEGGALYVRNSTANLGDADHSSPISFTENKAKKGGAVYVDTSSSSNASELNGNVVTMSSNIATSGGGALYTSIKKDTDSTVTVTITTLTVTQNSATGNGGAIYFYYNTVATIGTLTATGNTSSEYGGAIYASQKANVTITTVNASGNVAATGGFLYLTVGGTTVAVTNGTISDNTAADGGATAWGNSASSVLKFGADVSYPADSIAGKTGFGLTAL
ncbi:MAG: hypothetical protein IJA78_04620 [Clostridia bacterium]|nr:hypothetical protein [Clostridia bacterium]